MGGPARSLIPQSPRRSASQPAPYDDPPTHSRTPIDTPEEGSNQMATTTETLKNFIDGELVHSDGGSEPVLNPATGEELARAPRSTPEDVDGAGGAARRASDGWAQRPPAQRSEALLAIANVLEENGEELARLEALN